MAVSPNIVWPMPRRFGGIMVMITVSATGMKTPPVNPCPARKPIISPRLVETPHRPENNPKNLTMVIALYATLSKEMGLPLRFPGTLAAYQALYQVTSTDLLAKATAWAGDAPTAAGEIFNITNGDYFRWQFLWPRIARMFGMEVAESVPMPLAVYMADKGPMWEEIVRKHQLRPTAYEQTVRWQFGDFIFGSGFDNVTSTIKARCAGFHDCIDTEDMFGRFFDDLRRQKVIPTI